MDRVGEETKYSAEPEQQSKPSKQVFTELDPFRGLSRRGQPTIQVEIKTIKQAENIKHFGYSLKTGVDPPPLYVFPLYKYRTKYKRNFCSKCICTLYYPRQRYSFETVKDA